MDEQLFAEINLSSVAIGMHACSVLATVIWTLFVGLSSPMEMTKVQKPREQIKMDLVLLNETQGQRGRCLDGSSAGMRLCTSRMRACVRILRG